VTGVTLTDGRTLHAPVVVLTTGTFMRGLMHCGQRQSAGGRIGEGSATHLSASLESLGLVLGRLKTGTPPRVHRETIDYADCEEQLGDDPPTPFSFLTDVLPQRQVSCWITWTNETAHDHIRANLHRAPMYSGQIRSTGPRYCPSIEDKVVRFADKPRHQIFLEPEGYDTERVYCNGISTSLPPDVQEEVLRAIPALRGARILQHGYAVEYDWIPTWQTDITLQSRRVRGLFLAGQINGTSGYEEAAAQGIISGVNAARSLDHRDPLILGRDEAYIGVLIDDLITRPPTEPYRMFTSRAEYRLQLRSDNADHRLTPVGRRLGLVDDARWRRFEDRQRAVRQVVSLAARASYRGSSLAAWMRRPDAAIEHLAEALLGVTSETMGTDALEQALLEAKYDGYITRQSLHIERFRRLESLRIPDGYDYARVPELRVEAREALAQVCPRTMGQASRVGGVSPADLTVLWVHLSRPR
jgi:tRNA uridine 5-carboxymethylaminomethyl modification enzyme